MTTISYELAAAVFTPMILLSVVGLTILDYLYADTAGANEHFLLFSHF
jgi:hypothetical protein